MSKEGTKWEEALSFRLGIKSCWNTCNMMWSALGAPARSWSRLPASRKHLWGSWWAKVSSLANWQVGRLVPGASVACSPLFTECKPEVCRVHEGSEAGTGPGWGCELTDIACSGRTAARNANGRPHARASGSSAVVGRKAEQKQTGPALSFFSSSVTLAPSTDKAQSCFHCKGEMLQVAISHYRR